MYTLPCTPMHEVTLLIFSSSLGGFTFSFVSYDFTLCGHEYYITSQLRVLYKGKVFLLQSKITKGVVMKIVLQFLLLTIGVVC